MPSPCLLLPPFRASASGRARHSTDGRRHPQAGESRVSLGSGSLTSVTYARYYSPASATAKESNLVITRMNGDGYTTECLGQRAGKLYLQPVNTTFHFPLSHPGAENCNRGYRLYPSIPYPVRSSSSLTLASFLGAILRVDADACLPLLNNPVIPLPNAADQWRFVVSYAAIRIMSRR
jgi:hypothetical protein